MSILQKTIKTLIIFLFLFTFYSLSFAQEFRTINPIPVPEKVSEGAIGQTQPISREKVTSAVQEVFDSWNKGDIQKYIGKEFYDKNRLTDTLNTKVPKDAEIRLLSVQGVQTLNQYQTQSESGVTQVTSTVSVTANTQIEFNDVNKGFRKLEGTNEYIIRITEEIIKER